MSRLLSRLIGDRWSRLYFLVAVFAVATTAGSLYLTHRITSVFQHSVLLNEQWAGRVGKYSALGDLAAAVNAPGNDLFDDPSVDLQAGRLAAALSAFNAAVAEARAEARASLAGPARQVLLDDLDTVARLNADMHAEAQGIVEHFRRGEPGPAGRRMAMMDQRYAALQRALGALRADARRFEAEALHRHGGDVRALRRYEWALAAGVLLTLCVASVYGRSLSARLGRAADERARYLERLEASERILETRVAERTAELRHNERRLLDAQRVAHIGSWEWEFATGAISWSDETFRIFGVEPGSLQPSYERYLAFVHPDDRALVAATIRQTAETREPFRHEQRIVRADGAERITLNTGAVTPGPDGHPLLMTGTTQDVTEQRALEAARRQSEEQFRAFVETTNEWIWTCDPDGVLTYSNPAVFEILGYTPQEIVGRPSVSVLHPSDVDEVRAHLRSAAAAGEGWSGRVLRWRHREGDIRFLESNAVPVRGADGALLGFRGASRDVTARREAEEAARQFDERFQLAARATNDTLWDWDVASGALWSSDGFRRLVGDDSPITTRAEWQASIDPEDAGRVLDSLDAFLASPDETWSDEYRLRRPGGGSVWVLDRGLVQRSADGRPRRVIGSMMDITGRKEAERLKSDFVSFVSHQLRTPLAGMRWLLELAAEVDSVPAAAREYIQEAHLSGQRLLALVNDLLDIARLEQGRPLALPGRVALDVLTRNVAEELQGLAAGRRQEISISGPPIAPAWGDPQLLRQAITNLLSNAIKYTPDGGRIAIALSQTNGTLRWSVTDSGIGIPPAAQARLFEKFYRAENAVRVDAEGNGLGLHLVRLIIEEAGGRVWCKSEEGAGATFAFTVPAAMPGGSHG